MVHSFPTKEKLMDQALTAFRKAAAREHRGRHGLQRRYSRGLQAQAVGYWHARQRQGDRVRIVAAALGVAHWTLHRWIKASKYQARFQAVQVVTPVGASPAPRLVIELPSIGARVEGLDVDAAAKLLALLR
jgi:hypothetical protein